MKKRWRDREPNVRSVKGGVIIDQLDQYASEVAGVPPPDFTDVIDAAERMHKLAAEVFELPPDAQIFEPEATPILDRMRDAMLLAAYSYSQMRNDGKGESPLAFIQRAKQIVTWCKRPISEMTGLSVLENKARELARQVAMRLFKGEGFVLLVFNEGEGGHCTWISSGQRNDTIRLLEEMTTKMREDQAGLS